jgi:DNA-binding transcriptional LysR family regulator
MTSKFSDTLVFVKVVENRSFTAAAKALGLPTSTVSRKVRELEQRLGVQLLHRTTRRLALTEAGGVYHAHCNRIARDLEAAELAVSELAGTARGSLRVTVAYSLAVELIAPLLAEFSGLYPSLRVELVLSNSPLDLLAREIDMALRLGPAPLPDSSLVARRLGELRTAIYATPVYLERWGHPTHPRDLATHRTLALAAHRSHGEYSWRLESTTGEHVQATIRPALVADDPAPLVRAMLEDGGLLLVNREIMGSLAQSDGVARVLPEWAGPTLTLNALFPRNPLPSPKLRAFVDFLAERLPASIRDLHGNGPALVDRQAMS